MSDAIEIPDSVRARIGKLLALSRDSRGNEHETQMAAAKVQEMLAAFNLEMSQFTEGDDAPVDPDAVRHMHNGVLTLKGDMWEEILFRAIADANFCLRFVTEWGENDTREWSLVGRRINITTTMNVYDYLTRAVDRLCPYTDSRNEKAIASWKLGCAERLAQRVRDQRYEAEVKSRQDQQAKTPLERGNGSDLILSDVYSSEDDLNLDFKRGMPMGTTARERLAREAEWDAGEDVRRWAHLYVPVVEEKAETPGQKRKRQADERRRQREWDRESRKEAAKRDPKAYARGQETGERISLNRQVTH